MFWSDHFHYIVIMDVSMNDSCGAVQCDTVYINFGGVITCCLEPIKRHDISIASEIIIIWSRRNSGLTTHKMIYMNELLTVIVLCSDHGYYYKCFVCSCVV